MKEDDGNPYSPKDLPDMGGVQHRSIKWKAWNEGFEKGQQNPDPKKYALRDNCDTLAELREQVGWERGYGQGQQNPDPKQYAKREELWKETKKCTLPIAEMYRELEGSPKVPVITLVQANKIIRTHGLEE